MNHPNIDMDKIELLASKKCARMVCIIELLMIIVGMQIRNFEEISIMISLAIILCSVSMKLAQLVRQKYNIAEKIMGIVLTKLVRFPLSDSL